MCRCTGNFQVSDSEARPLCITQMMLRSLCSGWEVLALLLLHVLPLWKFQRHGIGVPGDVDVRNLTIPFDSRCPQSDGFSVLHCKGHMHMGAECIELYDALNGTLLCSSCATYGNSGSIGDVFVNAAPESHCAGHAAHLPEQCLYGNQIDFGKHSLHPVWSYTSLMLRRKLNLGLLCEL